MTAPRVRQPVSLQEMDESSVRKQIAITTGRPMRKIRGVFARLRGRRTVCACLWQGMTAKVESSLHETSPGNVPGVKPPLVVAARPRKFADASHEHQEPERQATGPELQRMNRGARIRGLLLCWPCRPDFRGRAGERLLRELPLHTRRISVIISVSAGVRTTMTSTPHVVSHAITPAATASRGRAPRSRAGRGQRPRGSCTTTGCIESPRRSDRRAGDSR